VYFITIVFLPKCLMEGEARNDEDSTTASIEINKSSPSWKILLFLDTFFNKKRRTGKMNIHTHTLNLSRSS
jgi:hypothetical protein